MKICVGLVNYKKAIAFVLLILCIFHFYTAINFLVNDTLISKSLPLEGNLNSQLVFVHLVFGMLLLIYAVSIAFETLISKTISLISSILIILVYFWWYYEKFAYLEPKGTLEYNQQISEIGLFQGATNLDYWAFAITILLIIYSICRFLCGIYAINED